MSQHIEKNHFELLNLPAQFAIDLAALDQHYRRIQSEVHPDRFVASTPSERLRSMQIATQTNEAYQTLKSPAARARYLLKLRGVLTEEESNTAMPADFLMLQMEWRDALEDAKAAQDITALDAMLLQMRDEARQLHQDLHAQLDEHQAWQDAAATVRKLSFIDKIRSDIEQAIARLED